MKKHLVVCCHGNWHVWSSRTYSQARNSIISACNSLQRKVDEKGMLNSRYWLVLFLEFQFTGCSKIVLWDICRWIKQEFQMTISLEVCVFLVSQHYMDLMRNSVFWCYNQKNGKENKAELASLSRIRFLTSPMSHHWIYECAVQYLLMYSIMALVCFWRRSYLMERDWWAWAEPKKDLWHGPQPPVLLINISRVCGNPFASGQELPFPSPGLGTLQELLFTP